MAGVLEQTGSQDDSLVFAALPKAQKLLGKEGKITLAEVAALCSGCPIGDMVTQIAEKIPDARVSAIQQVVEGRLKALDQFKRFSYAMAAVVVFIGSLIVFVTMMGSVNERTTEIGVFRAIGFRKSHIMRIILLEAALVSLLAGFLGYAAGMGGAKLALPFMAESKNAQLALGWLDCRRISRPGFDAGAAGESLSGAACQQDGPDRSIKSTVKSSLRITVMSGSRFPHLDKTDWGYNQLHKELHMALIEIKNLKKHYTSGDETVEALRGVDISIETGEFITIMGQSGSGKSTLLSVLGGMNHPTSG